MWKSLVLKFPSMGQNLEKDQLILTPVVQVCNDEVTNESPRDGWEEHSDQL